MMLREIHILKHLLQIFLHMALYFQIAADMSS